MIFTKQHELQRIKVSKKFRRRKVTVREEERERRGKTSIVGIEFRLGKKTSLLLSFPLEL